MGNIPIRNTGCPKEIRDDSEVICSEVVLGTSLMVHITTIEEMNMNTAPIFCCECNEQYKKNRKIVQNTKGIVDGTVDSGATIP